MFFFNQCCNNECNRCAKRPVERETCCCCKCREQRPKCPCERPKCPCEQHNHGNCHCGGNGYGDGRCKCMRCRMSDGMNGGYGDGYCD